MEDVLESLKTERKRKMDSDIVYVDYVPFSYDRTCKR